MRKVLATIFVFVVSVNLQAQKIQFGGLQQLSVSFNEHYTAPGLTFINGIRFSRFFTGLGVDARLRPQVYYGFGSYNEVAMFADARYYIDKKKSFFVKAQGGINCVAQRMASSDNFNHKRLAGYYTAGGIGVKAKIGSEVHYSFDLSYCLRQTRYNYSQLNRFRGGWDVTEYDLRRSMVVVTMGIEID
jgi:hypothetical protein